MWDFKGEDRSQQDLAVDKRANIEKITEDDGHLEKMIEQDRAVALSRSTKVSKPVASAKMSTKK